MKALKFSLLLSLCISFLFLLFPYCQTNEEDMGELKKTIEAFENSWNERDYLKVVGFYADDAVFFIPNEDVWEMSDIRNFFENQAKRPDTVNYLKYEINRENLELIVEGDIAYEFARQTFDVQIEGQNPVSMKNKFVHIWEKQEDGSWKLKFDMYNSSETIMD
jgi:ketosteroid isomerase-like protein